MSIWLTTPRRALMASASRGISWPKARTRPVSGAVRPEARQDGDGPAGAVGADHAQALAGRDGERQAVDHGLAAEALDQARR
ncbi:hypothetical protein [Thauera sp. SDU_THAU2]|uniref:hypothetical protein n=1 Tax=Thauera sp. SDU_THAU2 TaxID=3136633 RepID=UPI00311E88B3